MLHFTSTQQPRLYPWLTWRDLHLLNFFFQPFQLFVQNSKNHWPPWVLQNVYFYFFLHILSCQSVLCNWLKASLLAPSKKNTYPSKSSTNLITLFIAKFSVLEFFKLCLSLPCIAFHLFLFLELAFLGL